MARYFLLSPLYAKPGEPTGLSPQWYATAQEASAEAERISDLDPDLPITRTDDNGRSPQENRAVEMYEKAFGAISLRTIDVQSIKEIPPDPEKPWYYEQYRAEHATALRNLIIRGG